MNKNKFLLYEIFHIPAPSYIYLSIYLSIYIYIYVSSSPCLVLLLYTLGMLFSYPYSSCVSRQSTIPSALVVPFLSLL